MVASPPAPRADRHVRITVDEVDRATVADFARQLAEHPPGAYCLVVDLVEVTFIDAAGIDALLRAAQRMSAAGGTIALCNPRPIVRRLLAVLDLEELLAPR